VSLSRSRLSRIRLALNGEPQKAPHATAEEPSNEAEPEPNSGALASAGLRRSNAGCMTPQRGNPHWAFDWGFPPHGADWRPKMRYLAPAPVGRERLTIQRAFPALFPSPRGIPAHARRRDPLV
jgi:hypothetical protein